MMFPRRRISHLDGGHLPLGARVAAEGSFFAPRVAGRRLGLGHALFGVPTPLPCPVWQAWRLEGQWVSGRSGRPGEAIAAAAAGHSIIAFSGAIRANRLRGRCSPVDRVSPRPARNRPGGAPFPQSRQPRQHGRGSLAQADEFVSGALAAKLVAGAISVVQLRPSSSCSQSSEETFRAQRKAVRIRG